MPLRQPDLPIFTVLTNMASQFSNNITNVMAKYGQLYQEDKPKITLHSLEDILILCLPLMVFCGVQTFILKYLFQEL